MQNEKCKIKKSLSTRPFSFWLLDVNKRLLDKINTGEKLTTKDYRFIRALTTITKLWESGYE